MNTSKRIKNKVSGLASTLRNYRTYHRYTGLVIGLFVLISSMTGILLGWKKDVELLQPPVVKGKTTNLKEWVSVADLAEAAYAGLDSAENITNNPIDRIEARPDKGMVKVLFTEGYWEVQVDGSTGKVLSVARRHSDWIEQIHDGSIISDLFKLVSMNVLGIGLLILSFTGFTLWFFPRRIRKLKNQ
ncbi:PepSY domain-containing protein [Pontibacter locisalis]|uniref:PepSY domain-containing protein n=1 Tax=Pontibacter locisalis TaxID=1719035 RepID=A0ABW5IM03_9BACT